LDHRNHRQHLRAFFNWLVAEGIIESSPMARVPRPIVRDDQIHPLTNEQVKALVEAARRSYFPRHNEAVLRFLIDTGVRASELCGITLGDLDMSNRSVTVLGKGNKRRSVHFGVATSRTLWNHLRGNDYIPGENDRWPLFCSQSGPNTGCKTTRGGILKMVHRLGLAANISGVRCSPHTLRHTFAVNFIRNGGDPFSLMQLLGHTNLQMTNRYVCLAKADIAAQHAKCSPMDHMGF
jgi:integrase/recombinase XerC